MGWLHSGGGRSIARDSLRTDGHAERVFLVGVEVRGKRSSWCLDDSLTELAELARTAGAQVIGQARQRLTSINPGTYVGKGKVAELQAVADELDLDSIIFDDELSPGQQGRLEEQLGIKVLDRTALILDVFARHARTREGALQVELAQYVYRLPRLTRAWAHLARQAGGGAARGGAGGVGLRGPGETQLETDRRIIRRRIGQLKSELENVRRHRKHYRMRRQRGGLPVISMVGYTNTGKSTMLNALTNADVPAADKLFVTLDPVTRRLSLPDGKQVLLTDTVGFIQRLPTQLVAAFRATLEEISDADLILHVVDITHPNVREQVSTVERVLKELGAGNRPMLVALNKIDLLDGPVAAQRAVTKYANAVAVSALHGHGLDELLDKMENTLAQLMVHVRAHVPYAEGELLALFHRLGVVEHERYHGSGMTIEWKVPPNLAPRFKPYLE